MADDNSVVTLRDILEAVGDRAGRLETRMDKLIETTNHRLEAFEEAMETKADIKYLLPTAASQLMHSRIFWTIVLGVCFIMGPVVVDHWHMLVERAGY